MQDDSPPPPSPALGGAYRYAARGNDRVNDSSFQRQPAHLLRAMLEPVPMGGVTRFALDASHETISNG